MLRWLKAIVDWIFGRHVSLTQLSLQAPNASGVSSSGARLRPMPETITEWPFALLSRSAYLGPGFTTD